MFRFIVTLFISSITSFLTQAQSSAGANVSATIVWPVGTERGKDLSFGTFSSGATSGSIMLQASGTVIRKGAVKAVQSQIPQHLASFNIVGNNDYDFDVLLPANATAVKKNSGNGLKIESFTSTRKMLPGNIVGIEIGATLNVPPYSAVGDYVDRSGFSIIISYN